MNCLNSSFSQSYITGMNSVPKHCNYWQLLQIKESKNSQCWSISTSVKCRQAW